MESWIPIVIVVVACAIVIGSLSTLDKTSKLKMRPKGLNDLEETLPRTAKKAHKMKTVPDKNNSAKL